MGLFTMQQLFQTATVVHAAIARLTTEQESSTQIHALKKAKNFMAASATFKNTVLTLWRF